ncbi:LysE family translocator [Paralimibaculum aggregatum]|uniref:LysE family translocator n=1 Tax=Paralimibaculum aggregatum TaxID=3036245 RepID=A0ABQ6LGU2_9RHOB|nr:LysE family translocator [Limibaculum sp. NKW23]GMG82518.1 LysE family translocator [Limibaculum sp. NKW23]
MSYEILLAFAVASAVLLAIPGPTVMVVVAQALAGGRRTGLATVPGVVLGDATAMTVSLAGAGAVLAASATLFTLLKLAGAGYLVWLGVKLWRNPPETMETGAPVPRRQPMGRLFWQAYVVTALNPKSIVFFVAFVPQFIVAGEPLMPQLVALEAIFLGLAALNTALWAWAAGSLRARIGRPQVLRALGRTGAGFLIGAGLLTAAASRS